MGPLRKTSLALCLAAALTTPSVAATCIGISMPDSLDAGQYQLVLNGMGVRFAPFLGYPVYVAGLYLPARSGDPEAIIATDQPRRMILHFVESVNQSSMKSGLQRSLAKNANELTERLKEPIEKFQATMTGFEKGQTVTFDYDPERGTTVTIDEKTAGEFEGADFASAWISLWLGKPPNEELKTGLLGGSCS